DTASQCHRAGAGRDRPHAFAKDSLRQKRRRSGAVSSYIRSLRCDLAHEFAPTFSIGSLRSISLATVTPSLVMVGEPNFFSITTFRPLGPSVAFTASARMLTPRKI